MLSCMMLSALGKLNCLNEFIAFSDGFKLKYITHAPLYQDVEDIAVVRFYGDQMDSILLSFKEARVSKSFILTDDQGCRNEFRHQDI